MSIYVQTTGTILFILSCGVRLEGTHCFCLMPIGQLPFSGQYRPTELNSGLQPRTRTASGGVTMADGAGL